jgi:excinuclease ABC subunit C
MINNCDNDQNTSSVTEHVRTQVRSLPNVPGVYFFKDAAHAIIYIGKAKSIKKRVSSYFQKRDADWKVYMLVNEIVYIDYVPVNSETEALLLEADLVSLHKPKYNVLLKDGQPCVYLHVSTGNKQELPVLSIVRNKKQLGTYFGPFIFKQQVRAVHRYLIRMFKLKLCGRLIPTGCLEYHLGLCAGTCLKTFNRQEYIDRMNIVIGLLKGDSEQVKKDVLGRIASYSKLQAFEAAQRLHKYLADIDAVMTILRERFNEKKFAQDAAYAASQFPQEKIASSDVGITLQKLLGLDIVPQSIDCFDISHFQSRSIVGSCIRFTNGVPDKKKFRRFRIKTLVQQNDYAALQEIVLRRYRDIESIPDLILIDGGVGQLSAIKALDLPVPIISLAKKEETLFGAHIPDGIKLDVRTPVGKLLIALRDYAHHFAITYHRVRRSKRL